MKKKIFIFKFLLIVFLLLPIVLFERCSFVTRDNQLHLHDDTIKRPYEKRPTPVFYNGHFFQYYPVPKSVQYKDTTK